MMYLSFYVTDPCRKEYSPYDGFCFHIYTIKVFTRDMAQQYCHSIGGKLVIIENNKKWLAAYHWISTGELKYC